MRKWPAPLPVGVQRRDSGVSPPVTASSLLCLTGSFLPVHLAPQTCHLGFSFTEKVWLWARPSLSLPPSQKECQAGVGGKKKRMPSSGSGFLATEQTQIQSSHLGERSPPAKGPGSDNKQRGGEGFQEGPSPQELAAHPQTPAYFSFHSASPLPLQMGFITPIFLQGPNWLKQCNLVPRGWDLFYRYEVMQITRQREFCNMP